MIYKAFFGLQAFSDGEWQTYLEKFSSRIYSRSRAPRFHAVKPLLSTLASSNRRRVTAHNKISLLLTRKSIFHEASGLFYRHHTFSVPTLNKSWAIPPEISTGVQRVLNNINLVALTYEASICNSTYGNRVSRHLAMLPKMVSQLKELSVEFQVGFRYKCDEEIMLALQSSWLKLEMLKLCMLCPKRNTPTIDISSIAPGLQWYRELKDGGTQPERFPERIKLEAGKGIFFIRRRCQTLGQSVPDVDLTSRQQTPVEETWLPFRSSQSKRALNLAGLA